MPIHGEWPGEVELTHRRSKHSILVGTKVDFVAEVVAAAAAAGQVLLAGSDAPAVVDSAADFVVAGAAEIDPGRDECVAEDGGAVVASGAAVDTVGSIVAVQEHEHSSVVELDAGTDIDLDASGERGLEPVGHEELPLEAVASERVVGRSCKQ